MINKSILVFFGVLLAFSLARAEVRFPHGEYYENVDDLRVKVLGGFVNAKRTWYQGKWYFNRPWNALIFTYDSLSGSIESIDKNENVFSRDASNPKLFKFGETLTITQTETGFRWATRQGDWKDYDVNGRIIAYGDRNDTRVTFQFNAGGQLATVKDHNNNLVLSYEYDAQGKVRYVRDRENHQVEYRYSGDQLTEVVDVLGNVWKYTYASDRVATRTDPEGRSYTLSYDANGRVISGIDADGNGSSYVYDYDKAKREYYVRARSANGRIGETWYDRDGLPIRKAVNGDDVLILTKDLRKEIVTDRSGNATTYEYDQWRNLIKTTYADGSVRSYRHETNYSQLAERVDENGVKTLYDYDANGNITKKTEAVARPEQRVTEYIRDSMGYLLQVKHLGDPITAESIRSYTYDVYGNVLTETDPEGGVSKYTYDIMGKRLTYTDPNDEIWTYTYNAAGLLIKAVDPLDRATLYGYDKAANLVSITDPDTTVTRFAYDARGRLNQTTDANSKVSKKVYDPDGLLIEDIDELGKKIVVNYDSNSRPINSWAGPEKVLENIYGDDAHGLRGLPQIVRFSTYDQEFIYDKRHRTTRVIERPNGGQPVTAEFQYDKAGNLTSTLDDADRLTRWSYDALNRKVTRTDALNQVTQYVYDNRNNLITFIDASNRTTQYEYDRNNRLTKTLRPMGETSVQIYDPAGYLVERRDANGRKITFTYDAAGQLQTERHFAVVADTTPVKTITYNYNALGSLIGYDDGVTSAVYAYDNLQRKLSETVDYGPFQSNHQYTYYDNDEKKTYTGPDGVTLSYTYDSADRLTAVQIPGQGSIIVSQYQGFLPKQVTYPGGTRNDFGFDNQLRPISISVKDVADNALLALGYQYDNLSRITQKTTAQSAINYSYDALDRLTKVDYPGDPDETFSYDPIGNRLTDASGDSWSYNLNNELSSHGTTSYGYDDNGNRTLKTTAGQNTSYGYDADNNLIEIKDHSQTIIATYYHDPFGYRLWKDTGGVRTYFHYSDEGLAGELDATGSTTTVYGFTPSSGWSTAPAFIKQGGTYNYAQNDILGTPQKLTQANGSVQWSGTHKAFGDTQVSVANINNPLRFPGQYADTESGLSENHLRAYDPLTGRYLQTDPLGLSGSTNLYGYAGANPVSMTDPHGDIIPLAGFILYQLGRTAITTAGRMLMNAGRRCLGNRKCAAGIGGGTLGLGSGELGLGTAVGVGTAIGLAGPRSCSLPLPPTESDDPPWSSPLQNNGDGAGDGGAGEGADPKNDNPPAPTPATEGEPTAPPTPDPDDDGPNDSDGNRPNTRSDLDRDLKEKGFEYKGKSPNGYVTYKGPNGTKVTIKPNGEVIRTQRIWKSDGSGKFSQRQTYDGKPIPGQSHSTGHFVEPIHGPPRP